MPQLYELTTPGNEPLSLAEVKTYLKVDSATDDTLLAGIITTALNFGEKYTGRDFRANTWTLRQDDFEARICLRRTRVASITSIKYEVDGTLLTIVTSAYYVKPSVQFSEILLKKDRDWPTDGDFVTDGIEGKVEIIFVTAVPECIAQAKSAMLRHIADLYQNRGDCDVRKSAVDAGVTGLYDQIRIARV